MGELQTVTPAGMLQIAIEKGADINQLEKFIDLHERWEKAEAKKSYIKAMSEFRSKCPVIKKTRLAHNSTYAGLSETIEQIKGLLSENGLSHAWKTSQQDGQITVQCCVTHVDGHTECTQLTAGLDTTGSKNSIQALGSTVSYLERYTLFAILGLASSDQDNDGNIAVETISEEQSADLKSLIDEVGADESKFLKMCKITSLKELPVNKLEGAIKRLEAKRRA